MALGSEQPVIPPHVARAFQQAACKGYDWSVFFPEGGSGDGYAEGKKVCGECPIVTTCLDWSLNNPEDYGLWGGMTPKERKRFRRK